MFTMGVAHGYGCHALSGLLLYKLAFPFKENLIIGFITGRFYFSRNAQNEARLFWDFQVFCGHLFNFPVITGIIAGNHKRKESAQTIIICVISVLL
ncbi:hypothetical protein DN752_14955 [Echinicola strongylocentroti]|uniref:Uncharacterized protein n=2 Tax=Echinicola strongylocentroti TaxID=1795355 RepID=A0A2Z4IKP4_9BACT|nr:hypothetical protein DN752_14955 [Echinicola strongylocentroti]